MSQDWDDLVLVARVARPHGRRGEVILNLETDFPEQRFEPGKAVMVRRDAGPERLVIRSLWFMKGRPVVGFEGIGSIGDAETLAGRELRIPPEELAALPPGMYFHHDLVGCRVETTDGGAIGEVVAVEGSGNASRLVVRSPRGEELIPLAAETCPVIDPPARRIGAIGPGGGWQLQQRQQAERGQ